MLKGKRLLEEIMIVKDLYSPQLGEMFAVDLSGVRVRDSSAFGQDLRAFLQEHREDSSLETELSAYREGYERRGESYFTLATEIVEEVGLGYNTLLDTIYVAGSFRSPEVHAHISAVHEMAHAVHSRLADNAPDRAVKMIVGEGFAEHVCLDLFRERYAVDVSEAVRRYEHPPSIERAIGSVSLSLLKLLFPASGAYQASEYRYGRLLFRTAASEGIDAVSVLKSPPQSLDDIMGGAARYFSRLKG